MKHIVGMADRKVGKNGDILITYALGSCLALMIYDPVEKVGGLLHAMLPQYNINPEKARRNPNMFVDTSVPLLFKEVYAMGGKKHRMAVKAAGCAAPLQKDEMFKIGERNIKILKKLLLKNNVPLTAVDLGGSISRTVYFNLTTGRVIIGSKGKKWEI
jgi:chemotaxis protein CheD